jgi:hypothetical protein
LSVDYLAADQLVVEVEEKVEEVAVETQPEHTHQQCLNYH